MQISLIEFSVENFKIFKNRTTFSMLSRKNDEHTFESNSENILKTSFIYGPNASGKTSLLDAFQVIKEGILFSSNIPTDKDQSLSYYLPFLASDDSKNKPVFFEVVFSLENSQNDGIYRYNFSFLKNHIVSESLSEVISKGNEKEYFSRKEQEIVIKDKSLKSIEDIVSRTRKESLFLTMAAINNNLIALNILNAFKDINVISGVTNLMYQEFTIKKFKEDPNYKEKILKYLEKADFCISGGSTEEIDVQGINLMSDTGKFSVAQNNKKGDMLFLEHPIYNVDNEEINTFKLSLFDESMGTQKFLSILGPIIDTINDGKVLFVDEFDNSLHPLLTKFIVDLFESNEINKNNAQLIVTTHDTSLLAYKDEYLKDQFWFTEKNEFGVAKLFSLADFKMRNDTEFSKKYLEGRFGALPFIG